MNGLKWQFDINFARVDVNFQMFTVTQFCYNFFSILIPINIKVLLIVKTEFQPKIPSHVGEMGLNARFFISFILGCHKFSKAIVTQFHYRFFQFDINQDQGATYTSYKISAKYT